jgi:hypothetical protein
MIRTNLLLAGDDGGYNLTKSLRFRSSASAYLNRTFSTPTLSTKWTWSGWIKFGYASTYYTIFDGGSPDTRFGRDPSTNQLYVSNDTTNFIITTPVYRDYSSWYHAVLAFDSSQGTASNRLRLYINGSEVTAFATDNRSSISGAIGINTATAHGIGRQPSGGSAYFDGYLTEVNFIDGQQLTPSSFGSTNALTGVWQPAKYTGTYGTNGFYLPFTNATSTSTLGNDFSGNSNTWTVNNISLTAGTTYDSMTDVPTLTSATAANYPTINAVNYNSTYITLSEANLRQTYAGVSAAAASQATMAIPTTGKFYWEVYINATGGGSGERVRVGICAPTDSVDGNTIDNSANHYMQMSNGQKRTGTTDSTYGSSFSAGQIIQVLYDATAGAIYFGKNDSYANGTGSFNQTFSTATAAFTSLSGTFIPAFVTYGGADISVNFGQRPFTYTPPTGFVALNTYNLPTSTIVKGNTVMDATTYTGTGSSLSVVNTAGFKPDLVWAKNRGLANYNVLTDSVRGVQKQIYSNTTDVEATGTDGLTAFNSNGFTVGTNANWNNNTYAFVGWQWQAGQGSSSSNTSGSITSTVSVNASAGFSIATYTGNGSTGATVGHGLGVAPAIIIVKKRSSTGNWITYHTSTGVNQYLYLNSTSASATATPTWGVSSTTFTLQQSFSDYNDNGVTYVAYCWSQIAGFSSFGSYTGNGSTDGPFIYTGFRPRFVLIKNAGATGDWTITDTSRDTYNAAITSLYPNLANSEGGGNIDILSNGFKIHNTTYQNGNGNTMIYAAFAENPFKNALAR